MQIIEVKLKIAPSEQVMTSAMLNLAGAILVLWCPAPQEGKPYKGHAHLELPAGVNNPVKGPISSLGN